MNCARIHTGLTRLNIPWRTTKADLKSRNGVLSWPTADYRIVPVDSALPSLLAPLSFADDGHSPMMPPTYLSGYLWTSQDAEANLAAARAAFEPVLGPPSDGRGMSRNIKAWEWVDRPATVKLTVWPRTLNNDRGRNVIHDAEPRTRDACSISIRSGYRLPCSEIERDWLERMDVFASVRMPYATIAEKSDQSGEGTVSKILSLIFGKPKPWPGTERPTTLLERMNWESPFDRMLEFDREAPADYADHYGKIGIAPGGDALISCTETLLIVPAAIVRAIEIVTITPGRSWPSGGIEVAAKIRLPYAADHLESLNLGFGDVTVAEALAMRLGIPAERSEVWGD